MKAELTQGAIVQFKMDWGKVPTVNNTCVVTQVADDLSWADVVTHDGEKRVSNPLFHLKIVTEPLISNEIDFL